MAGRSSSPGLTRRRLALGLYAGLAISLVDVSRARTEPSGRPAPTPTGDFAKANAELKRGLILLFGRPEATEDLRKASFDAAPAAIEVFSAVLSGLEQRDLRPVHTHLLAMYGHYYRGLAYGRRENVPRYEEELEAALAQARQVQRRTAPVRRGGSGRAAAADEARAIETTASRILGLLYFQDRKLKKAARHLGRALQLLPENDPYRPTVKSYLDAARNPPPGLSR